MSNDRKRMRKLRKKRVVAVRMQIEEHRNKIANEEGARDTTKEYWQKEIDEKFVKQLEEDTAYLDEEK
jgi:uncharacterized protein YhfF